MFFDGFMAALQYNVSHFNLLPLLWLPTRDKYPQTQIFDPPKLSPKGSANLEKNIFRIPSVRAFE